MEPLKIAIVHEWLASYAGSERVLEQLLRLYPQADVYAVVDFLPEQERGFLGNKPVRTSFIQRLPAARKAFRHYLPLMPMAIEQFDLRDYDLILSSNHAVAKGVLTGPDQIHVCYMHSPIRYAWDMQGQYLQGARLDSGLKSWLARTALHYMRIWDSRTAHGVDHFVANSHFIARRIRKVYGRNSEVIHPPVDTDAFAGNAPAGDFFLAASRMVAYKKMPLIVEAFARMPSRRLVVIGDGPDLAHCRKLATPNIDILGYQPFPVLRDHMLRARAFVFAGEEDFGITLVEAQAAGTPVIAFGRGGARDIVRAWPQSAAPTGLFFHEQTAQAIVDAVERFVQCDAQFTRENCVRNASRFAAQRFRTEMGDFVAQAVAQHRRHAAARVAGMDAVGS